MLISLLMPMRNAMPYVQTSLESVLLQDGVDLEVIVIDDGSTDDSAKMVRWMGDERIRLVPGPQQGISAALNCGLDAARGDLLCRCDADDLYPPARLKRQHDWLAAHPDFDAICGSFSTITSRGKLIADLHCGADEEEITAELRRGHTRTHLGTFLMRTDAVRRAGGFRPWFTTAEDIDLQLRLGEAGRVWFEPISSYRYRLHDASITHLQPSAARVFFEASARQFLAQRQATGQDDLQRGSPPQAPAATVGASAPMSSRRQVQGMLVGSSWRYHAAGQKGKSLALGLRACLVRPASLSVWKNLLALALKSSGGAGAG
jgi:glycosyltransferase involved in cell wall biosynthesis